MKAPGQDFRISRDGFEKNPCWIYSVICARSRNFKVQTINKILVLLFWPFIGNEN
ncbi:hypothetical protein NC653_039033 [Populus alba x Populus x berolinensis]|uniref:Uncharacterized protein n=1 Tax=Populus alba x Populus x berolinensis TaxID=444605 RepID=A0AAD6LA87_9ROSI|nr:hypothetical protein NC653_039033 [Populus alba x Populus x berolinensis]